MQLDLFEIGNVDYAKEIRKSIYEKLKHYGIDDYFEQNIKGQSMLLRGVRRRLSNRPNYKEYLSRLVDELSKYVSTISHEDSFDVDYSHLVSGLPYVRYYCRYHSGKSIGVYSALFCLSELPIDFFIK